MNPLIPTNCPFEILGYIEEFDDAVTYKPLGFRKIAEPDRPCGSPGRREILLTEPLSLLKGYKETPVVVRASCDYPRRVMAMIQIICGKMKGH